MIEFEIFVAQVIIDFDVFVELSRSDTVRLIDDQQNMVKMKCLLMLKLLISAKIENFQFLSSLDWFSFQRRSGSKS